MFWYYLVNHTRKEYCQLMPSDLGDSRRNFAYPINWTQQDQVEIMSKKTFYTVEAADGKYDEVDMFDLGVDSEEDFSGPSDLSDSEDDYSHSHSPQSGGSRRSRDSRRSRSNSESSRHSHSESSSHSHSDSESEDSSRGHSRRRHHSDSEESDRGHSDTEEVKRPEEIKKSEEPRRSDGLAKRLVEVKPPISAKLSAAPTLREVKRPDEASKRVEEPKRLVEVSKRSDEVSKVSDSRKSRK